MIIWVAVFNQSTHIMFGYAVAKSVNVHIYLNLWNSIKKTNIAVKKKNAFSTAELTNIKVSDACVYGHVQEGVHNYRITNQTFMH